jgi:acetoin:2,6-dichlorophenolindophenol oxidoreductase subunit alpha
MKMNLTEAKKRDMYLKLWRSRLFEQSVNEMFMRGEIKGTTHLSVGQEGAAVGVISAINEDDLIMSCHRGHSHCIAKNADLRKMMSELIGKRTGFCKGLGGSMHIVDIGSGNYGANGIIGPAIGIATGIALALKKNGEGKIIADFFGDGTSNTGNFHESLNMAALWKLPILYICENNRYGMSTSVEKCVSVPNIADRAAAYGIPGVICDGNDVLAIIAVVEEAASRARNGCGPTLIELKTYRWLGHSKSDRCAYRTKEEEAEWKAKCPILRFGEYMLKTGSTQQELDEIKQRAADEVLDAVEYALKQDTLSIDEARALIFA